MAGTASVFDSATPTALGFDVTAPVRSWHERIAPNDGVLLKLEEWQEGYDVSGPAFPSSSFPDAAVRPRIVVSYTPPSG